MTAAIRRLWLKPPALNSNTMFEASAFGMFTLIKALHCLIWHATHYDPLETHSIVVDELGTPSKPPPGPNNGLDSQLKADFSGPHIATLATQAVCARGATNFIDINIVLENWMKVWSCRQIFVDELESVAYSLDPLPFFWLAKLFLLLHCAAEYFPADGEFTYPRFTVQSNSERVSQQVKVMRWLFALREARDTVSGQGNLSRKEGSSLTSLMEPLKT